MMKSTLLFVLFVMVTSIIPSSGNVSVTQEESAISIGLDTGFLFTKTGDEFSFKSTITNNGNETTRKLIVAMNIVNLGDGTPVDPEDWSPQRTQFINPLGSGGSQTLSWIVYTIVKGDYAVYLVVIPIPESKEETSIAISSSAIHLTVSEFSRLNPQGILPFVIGIPIVLIVFFLMIRRRRNKMID